MTAESEQVVPGASMPAPPFSHLIAGRQIVLTRGSAADARTDLMDWDGFMTLVLSGAYPSKLLRVTRQNGVPLPPAFFQDRDGVKAGIIGQLMETGGSLIAYGIAPSAPALAQFTAQVSEDLGERIEAGVIATRGPGGALNVHFDEADVFVMQIEGRKRWIIYEDRVDSPYPGAPSAGPTPPPGAAVALDAILEAGDSLFMPAGHWHHCENMGERSLHAALLIWPLSQARILDLLFREALEPGDARTALRGAADQAAAIEAAKAALVEKISALSPQDLIARHLARPVMSGNG